MSLRCSGCTLESMGFGLRAFHHLYGIWLGMMDGIMFCLCTSLRRRPDVIASYHVLGNFLDVTGLRE
jgi:hypothetical protein